MWPYWNLKPSEKLNIYVVVILIFIRAIAFLMLHSVFNPHRMSKICCLCDVNSWVVTGVVGTRKSDSFCVARYTSIPASATSLGSLWIDLCPTYIEHLLYWSGNFSARSFSNLLPKISKIIILYWSKNIE